MLQSLQKHFSLIVFGAVALVLAVALTREARLELHNDGRSLSFVAEPVIGRNRVVGPLKAAVPRLGADCSLFATLESGEEVKLAHFNSRSCNHLNRGWPEVERVVEQPGKAVLWEAPFYGVGSKGWLLIFGLAGLVFLKKRLFPS